jgi:hypothetical protein
MYLVSGSQINHGGAIPGEFTSEFGGFVLEKQAICLFGASVSGFSSTVVWDRPGLGVFSLQSPHFGDPASLLGPVSRSRVFS